MYLSTPLFPTVGKPDPEARFKKACLDQAWLEETCLEEAHSEEARCASSARLVEESWLEEGCLDSSREGTSGLAEVLSLSPLSLSSVFIFNIITYQFLPLSVFIFTFFVGFCLCFFRLPRGFANKHNFERVSVRICRFALA